MSTSSLMLRTLMICHLQFYFPELKLQLEKDGSFVLSLESTVVSAKLWVNLSKESKLLLFR
jgi:hypothetical protein